MLKTSSRWKMFLSHGIIKWQLLQTNEVSSYSVEFNEKSLTEAARDRKNSHCLLLLFYVFINFTLDVNPVMTMWKDTLEQPYWLFESSTRRSRAKTIFAGMWEKRRTTRTNESENQQRSKLNGKKSGRYGNVNQEIDEDVRGCGSRTGNFEYQPLHLDHICQTAC